MLPNIILQNNYSKEDLMWYNINKIVLYIFGDIATPQNKKKEIHLFFSSHFLDLDLCVCKWDQLRFSQSICEALKALCWYIGSHPVLFPLLVCGSDFQSIFHISLKIKVLKLLVVNCFELLSACELKVCGQIIYLFLAYLVLSLRP